MKLTKIILLLTFTFSCVALTSAQLPPLPPEAGKPTKIIGKANIYEFKTGTLAESVFLNRNGKQIISAAYWLPADQTGEKPKSVQMAFQSFSDNGLKYKNNPKLVITLNDKGATRKKTRIVMASCNEKNECHEVLAMPLFPFTDFEAMLKAKKVKIQFGDTVFELTPEEKDGLRDLQRTLEK